MLNQDTALESVEWKELAADTNINIILEELDLITEENFIQNKLVLAQPDASPEIGEAPVLEKYEQTIEKGPSPEFDEEKEQEKEFEQEVLTKEEEEHEHEKEHEKEKALRARSLD